MGDVVLINTGDGVFTGARASHITTGRTMAEYGMTSQETPTSKKPGSEEENLIKQGLLTASEQAKVV